MTGCDPVTEIDINCSDDPSRIGRDQSVDPSGMEIVTGSFLHLRGIGPKGERSIWDQGIPDWYTFRDTPKVHGISRERKERLDMELERCDAILRSRTPSRLAVFMPRKHIWRLYGLLRKRAVFLDIETTGLSKSARITILGMAKFSPDGEKLVYRSLVRGMDLTRSEITNFLRGISSIVTFNGSTFDLPMIRREFRDLLPDLPHFDLRYMAGGMGLTGGLKALEGRLGIGRDPEVQMIAGNDAVRLWRIWERRGHKRALETLVDYNREDVINLAPLASLLFEMRCKRMLSEIRSPSISR